MTPAKLLIIEDELPIRSFLRPAIDAAGHQLIEASNAKEGLLLASETNPDLVLLDLGLPDMEGFDVITRLREWYRRPIIVLSARGQDVDKVRALDAGADDYLHKPFSVAEFMARVRVALRHASTAAENSASAVQVGDILIDLAKHEVRRKSQLVHLTPIEYKLLTTFIKHAGLVLTHRQLLKEVWGPGHADEANSLRLYVHQLRQKLEENPSRPRHLITEAGVGYRFRSESA